MPIEFQVDITPIGHPGQITDYIYFEDEEINLLVSAYAEFRKHFLSTNLKSINIIDPPGSQTILDKLIPDLGDLHIEQEKIDDLRRVLMKSVTDNIPVTVLLDPDI
ncbi:MAG: hypothetical protein H7A51_13425 [Akkermansiaceae bacterium]|nr:hypothetical protein [Akkermansiaceae bacterium]